MTDVTRSEPERGWFCDFDTGIWRRKPDGNYEPLPHGTVVIPEADHLAALERVRVETRVEERAGLIRDAWQQRAYYRERFGSQPGWGELMMMLEDDWLARQRAGEFDDEVAVKIRAARVEALREARAAVDRVPSIDFGELPGGAPTVTDRRPQRVKADSIAAIDNLINAATTGDTDD